MTDVPVVTIYSLEAVTTDWLLTPMGIPNDNQQLATMARVALGTDRRATPDDKLPDPRDTDRRGWWGDLDAEAIWKGWPIGCRLWLLARAKIVDSRAKGGATVAKVEQYCREAFQPLVDNKIASRVLVSAKREGVSGISAMVQIYRAGQSPVALQFQQLWDQLSPTAS